MHVAVLYRKSKIVPLLLKGADVTLTTTEFVYCNNKFGKQKLVRMKVNAQQLAWNCMKHKALAVFERFEKDTLVGVNPNRMIPRLPIKIICSISPKVCSAHRLIWP